METIYIHAFSAEEKMETVLQNFPSRDDKNVLGENKDGDIYIRASA